MKSIQHDWAPVLEWLTNGPKISSKKTHGRYHQVTKSKVNSLTLCTAIKYIISCIAWNKYIQEENAHRRMDI